MNTPIKARKFFTEMLDAWKTLEVRNKALVAFYFIFVLCLNYFVIAGNLKDDFHYANVKTNVIEFVVHQFFAWSSRSIIEMLVYTFSKLPVIFFKIVNTSLLLAFPFLLAKLLANGNRENAKIQSLLFAVVCLVLMYPFPVMGETGWQATTINYLWPLVAAITALLVLQKALHGENLSRGTLWGGLAAMVLACNTQLLCVILLSLLLLVVVFRRGNAPRFLWFLVGICIFSITYHLLAPGNASRTLLEISTWMPNFTHLSVYDKLFKGYESTVLHMMFTMDYIYYTLAGLLVIHVFARFERPGYYCLALVPLMSLCFPSMPIPTYMGLHVVTPDVLWQYVALLISVADLVAVVWNIMLVTPSKGEAVFVIVVLGICFAQRMIMGFSPTLYMSGMRTFFFLFMGIVCCTAWLYSRLASELPPKALVVCDVFFFCMAFLGFVNQNLPLFFRAE